MGVNVCRKMPCVWCRVGHCVVAPLYLHVCRLATQADVCTYGWLLAASVCEPCPICILRNGNQSQHGYFVPVARGRRMESNKINDYRLLINAFGSTFLFIVLDLLCHVKLAL